MLDVQRSDLVGAVVGSGTMGRGIVQVLAQCGVRTLVFDAKPGAAQAAKDAIAQALGKLAEKGRLQPADVTATLGRIEVVGALEALKPAHVVVEAIIESLEPKRELFRALEGVVREDCILASNTSSLSVTAMAADLEHPERVVGLHFFNPVALMPLLEVVRAQRTNDATLATAFAVGKNLRKSCVLVKDAPAFVVNRLLTRFTSEVFQAIDAGTPLDVVDQALDPLGLHDDRGGPAGHAPEQQLVLVRELVRGE